MSINIGFRLHVDFGSMNADDRKTGRAFPLIRPWTRRLSFLSWGIALSIVLAALLWNPSSKAAAEDVCNYEISLINSSERVFWASASIKSGRLFAATGRCCGGFWLWLAVSLVGHGSGGLRDGRRRFPGMLGEAFQVLGGGGEQELVVGAGEAPEPEAPEAHVAF